MKYYAIVTRIIVSAESHNVAAQSIDVIKGLLEQENFVVESADISYWGETDDEDIIKENRL